MRNLYTRLTSLSHSASRSSLDLRTPNEDAVEQVSLVQLNSLLQVLAEVFPEHQVSLLRELLLDASPESRLLIAANALIQNQERYAQRATRLPSGQYEDWEKFRSTQYRVTVENVLITEFQGLTKSTVRNIVSENNGDYTRSREALTDVASKSWRFNLRAWVTRRPKSASPPFINVLENPTGCLQLDEEIYALGRPERDAQSLRDEQLARSINEDEHAQAEALIECECCFGDFTWEDIAVCTNGHFFCHRCLDRSVKEALYGQGGCLFREKGSVRCISSVALPACQGFVSSTLLPRVLPAETFDRLEQRLSRDQLQSSGLPLVHCPACTYAAVDTSISPRLRPPVIGPLALFVMFIVRLFFQYLPVFVALHLFIFAYLYCIRNKPYGIDLRIARTWIIDAMTRVRRRRIGVSMIFKCENPRCRISTCIECGKEWTAFHDCHREALDSRQQALDSQRLYVERAMSEAVKRTCPRCRMSFVKAGGCNMLTCPCGYEMCYICRADVGGVRYKHFCQHFRLEAGQPCSECDRCNLFEAEDEHAVAGAAAKCAAKEWSEKRVANMIASGSPVIDAIRPNAGLAWTHMDNVWLYRLERGLECLFELLLEW